MLQWSNIILLSVCACLFLPPYEVWGQDCNLTIRGHVKDIATNMPIAYATIFLEETKRGVSTDEQGFFQIDHVCEGMQHMFVRHVACETQVYHLTFRSDSTLDVFLHHYTHILDKLIVKEDIESFAFPRISTLLSTDVEQTLNQNLARLLNNIPGVNMITNGEHVAKPIIHGMYGNRLTIINNGVPQSGQQWGNDHGPEIDPWIAERISVIRAGTRSIPYGGSSLGATIVIKPSNIEDRLGWHGKGSYYFNSNGFGQGIHAKIQRQGKIGTWQTMASFRKSGDSRTTNYYLRNTGQEQASFVLRWHKPMLRQWTFDFYGSSYYTRQGILRGSHIGNQTDLMQALTRSVPFFTQPFFTYDVEAPFQHVNHHLLKLQAQYHINDYHKIDFIYGGQWNIRKEYDVRRASVAKQPSLSLDKWTHFFDIRHYSNFKNIVLKTGIQLNIEDNTNVPETGILPLIPDYISYRIGYHATADLSLGKILLELGGRYDYTYQDVATISRTLPRRVVYYRNNFHSYSFAVDVAYQATQATEMLFSASHILRYPAINELYSYGLHQGVSGIEEGYSGLSPEAMYKLYLTVKTSIVNKLFIETHLYYQHINNYIYLRPELETRLTIRGAFLVFKYQQTNAYMYGFDGVLTYRIMPQLSLSAQYSYLLGHDSRANQPLVSMPANSLLSSIQYEFDHLWGLDKAVVSLHDRYVFRQDYYVEDFAPPPEAYNLLGIKILVQKKVKDLMINSHIAVENLLNVTYRDYLNRQRYFADDLGASVVIGVGVSF